MADNYPVIDGGGSLATKASTQLPGGAHADKIVTVLVASGILAATASLTAVGQTAAFAPIAGRDFNVTISGGVARAVVERQFTGDAAWYVVLTEDMVAALPPSFTLNESEVGVSYRVRVVSYASGTINARVSQ